MTATTIEELVKRAKETENYIESLIEDLISEQEIVKHCELSHDTYMRAKKKTLNLNMRIEGEQADLRNLQKEIYKLLKKETKNE